MDDRNGYLCLEWVYDNADEEGWEPVGVLDYWQTHAVIEALKPYVNRCENKLQYYLAKGEQNRGTEVLEDAAQSANHALNMFTNVLDHMKDRYKQTEGI